MKKQSQYAYIFDFDGVLVDTMSAHFECYRQALADVGVPIDREQFYRQAGMTGIEQIRYFVTKAGRNDDPQLIYQRKKELWKANRAATDQIGNNLELLNILRAQGVRTAIATGSSRQTIESIMAEHGIVADVVIAAEDVQRGKPFPDLFLCAAEKLGVAPQDCVVIEDSDAGIEAAQAAGMKCLRFYDNFLPPTSGRNLPVTSQTSRCCIENMEGDAPSSPSPLVLIPPRRDPPNSESSLAIDK